MSINYPPCGDLLLDRNACTFSYVKSTNNLIHHLRTNCLQIKRICIFKPAIISRKDHEKLIFWIQ